MRVLIASNLGVSLAERAMKEIVARFQPQQARVWERLRGENGGGF